MTAEPALLQVSTTTTAAETLQPRVMQVLVVLARANGAIVSRDAFVRQCWEGRIVGDDSINRIISRLRRLAEERGNGSFQIETITKVGYRLIGEVTLVESTVAPPLVFEADTTSTKALAVTPLSASVRRRGPVVAMLLVGLVLAAVVGWRLTNPAPRPLQAALRVGTFNALSADVPAALPAALGNELQRQFSRAINKSITIARTPPNDDVQAYVVDGTIRRTGDSPRYTVNLTREGTGETPISLTFDGPANGSEAMIGAIVGETTEVVTCTLVGSVDGRIVPLPDPTIAFWAKFCATRPSDPGRDRAYRLVTLRETVKASPDFAIAWVTLANVLALDIPDADRKAGRPAYDEAMAALTTAQKLPGDSYGILNGRARLLPIRALAARETLLREPAQHFAASSYGEAPGNYANFLWNVGRIEDALVQNKLAVQISPENRPLKARTQMLLWAGKAQEADALIREVDAASPVYEVLRLARLKDALQRGDLTVVDETLAETKSLPPAVREAARSTVATLRSGDQTAKAQLADRWIALNAHKETRSELAIEALSALGRDADALEESRLMIFARVCQPQSFSS